MNTSKPSTTARLGWIEQLRLPLMIGVVMIHAYDPVRADIGEIVSLQGRGWLSDFVMFSLSQAFARLAVPVFFLLAGYFFVANSTKRRVSEAVSALKKRFHSLVIPYIFWNSLLLIAVLLLGVYGWYHPAPDSRIGEVFAGNSTSHLFHVFGIWGYPIAYQFWFLRDLILLCALGFVLAFVRTEAVSLIALFSAIGWIFGLGADWFPALGSIVFFTTGMALRRFSVFPDKIKNVPRWVFLSYLALGFSEYFVASEPWYPFFHKGVLVLGVISIFHIASSISINPVVSRFMSGWAPASFFLFAFHEPMLTLLKKKSFAWVTTSSGALTVYFGVVMTSVSISLLTFAVLRRFFPRILGVITGGRKP